MRAATIAPTYSGRPTGVLAEHWEPCKDSVKCQWITVDRNDERDATLAEAAYQMAKRQGCSYTRAMYRTRTLVRRVRQMRKG